MVVKKSPLEFRLNDLVGRLAEGGFLEWFEKYAWFTINNAAFLPRQSQLLKYSSTNSQHSLSVQTEFFTLESLRTAFMYYGGMLTFATLIFICELLFQYKLKAKYIHRPIGKLLFQLKHLEINQ